MKKIIICLVCCFLLSGCRSVSDYIEPENRIIVSALGFDEVDNSLLLTAECININTTNNKDSYDIKIVTGNGNSVETALANLETKLDGELLFSQCPIMLLSDQLSNNYISNLCDFLVKEEGISLAVRLVACESANYLITANEDNKPCGYQLMSLLRYSQNSLGFTMGDSTIAVLNGYVYGHFKMPFVQYDNTYSIYGALCVGNEFRYKFDVLGAQILYTLTEDLSPCKISIEDTVLDFKKSSVKFKDDILSVEICVKNSNFKEQKLAESLVRVLKCFNFNGRLKLKVVGEM